MNPTSSTRAKRLGDKSGTVTVTTTANRIATGSSERRRLQPGGSGALHRVDRVGYRVRNGLPTLPGCSIRSSQRNSPGVGWGFSAVLRSAVQAGRGSGLRRRLAGYACRVRRCRDAAAAGQLRTSPGELVRYLSRPVSKAVAASGASLCSRPAGTTVRGEALITRKGIEGGAIYAVSSVLREAIAATGDAVLHIALRPDLAAAELSERLTAPRGKQSLSTFPAQGRGAVAARHRPPAGSRRACFAETRRARPRGARLP